MVIKKGKQIQNEPFRKKLFERMINKNRQSKNSGSGDVLQANEFDGLSETFYD